MYTTITRLFGANEWRAMEAVDIADALNAPAALAPMTLIVFFAAVVAAGGDAEKLGELWSLAEGRWTDRAEVALAAGDLSAVSGLVATIPAATKAAVGEETMTAIANVVTANTLSAGAALWVEGGDAPESFTAESVTDALEDAGYAWSGSAWALA